MSSVRLPRVACSTAIAAAHVVLPTPPLPPMKWTRGTDSAGVFVAFECRVDACDLVVLRREGRGPGTLPPIADLAQARQDIRLEMVEILLRHFTELHAHLCFQQLFAQRRVVVQ